MSPLLFAWLISSVRSACDPLNSSPLTLTPLTFASYLDFYFPLIPVFELNCSVSLDSLSYQFSLWNLTHTYIFYDSNSTSSCEAGSVSIEYLENMVMPGPDIISAGAYNYTITAMIQSFCLYEATGETSIGRSSVLLITSVVWTPTSPIPNKSASLQITGTNTINQDFSLTTCRLQFSIFNSISPIYNMDCKIEVKPYTDFTVRTDDFVLDKDSPIGGYIYILELFQDGVEIGKTEGFVLVGEEFPVVLHIISPINDTVSNIFNVEIEATNLTPGIIESNCILLSLSNSTSYIQLASQRSNIPFTPGQEIGFSKLITLSDQEGSLVLHVEIISDLGVLVGVGSLQLQITLAKSTAFFVFPQTFVSNNYIYMNAEWNGEDMQPLLIGIANYSDSQYYFLSESLPAPAPNSLSCYLLLEDMLLSPGEYATYIFYSNNQMSSYQLVTILPQTYIWTANSTVKFPPLQLFPGTIVEMETVLQAQEEMQQSIDCKGNLWNSTWQWSLESTCAITCEVVTCTMSLSMLTLPIDMNSGKYVLQVDIQKGTMGSVSSLITVSSFQDFTPVSISLIPSYPLPSDAVSLSLAGTSTLPFFPSEYQYYLWNTTFQLSLNGSTDVWPISPGPGAFLVSVPELFYAGSEVVNTGEYMLAMCLTAGEDVCWETAVTVIEGDRAVISAFQWSPATITPGSEVSFSFSLHSISQGDFDSSLCSLLIYNSTYVLSETLACPAGLIAQNSSVNVQASTFQLPTDMEPGEFVVQGWAISKWNNQNGVFSTTLNVTSAKHNYASLPTVISLALLF